MDRRRTWRKQFSLALALSPMLIVVLVAYIGSILWTVRLSMTNSRLLPTDDFVGLLQYRRLFANDHFYQSVIHLAMFGAVYIIGCLVLGFLLAVFIDQQVRAESTLRAIFLLPHALSFVVTGVIWQWLFNPDFGIQQIVRDLGFGDFRFDWLVQSDRAIYAIALAGVWQSAGLVMVILLAGIRGINEDLWKAARVDGIPKWRYYTRIVLPLIQPMVATALVLLVVATFKLYDLVVTMTHGGPGGATDVPATFIMDNLFERANVGRAMAAATMLLLMAIVVLSPWIYLRTFKRKR
ncbi:sugar ABC transporter permease [Brenneria goodwinii]|nr:sugar ABC transporter permease [Brenneria goodwinii]MCG8156442.1 sugar ABC transporter permease [Brenneria goodwinii]MCG8163283.1 sugar ABC transporter permease [Brenneria goodwinii]MCG8167703.1 sugar ABC transporter permease [Brenneria goodwinii]MCG8172272.1 sugar ABC transporter permease [Brenneria goodwinii]MCG8175157.1 sugar ABC transporter permease [Brenneria goodwinii]